MIIDWGNQYYSSNSFISIVWGILKDLPKLIIGGKRVNRIYHGEKEVQYIDYNIFKVYEK